MTPKTTSAPPFSLHFPAFSPFFPALFRVFPAFFLPALFSRPFPLPSGIGAILASNSLEFWPKFQPEFGPGDEIR